MGFPQITSMVMMSSGSYPSRKIHLAGVEFQPPNLSAINPRPMNFLTNQIQRLAAPLKRSIAAVGGAAVIINFASCVTKSSIQVPTGEDLKGTWSQTGAGFEKGGPVTWENQAVVIEKADGQGFAGFKEYTREGERPQKESVNGVIGFNGDVLIVDEDGTFKGRLVGGKLQGQYAEIGGDAAAINVELTRKSRRALHAIRLPSASDERKDTVILVALGLPTARSSKTPA